MSTNVLGHRIGRRRISTYEKKNRSCLMGKKKKHFLRFLNPGFFIFGSKRWLRDGIFSNFYFELDRKISETAKSRGSGFENLENIPSEQSRKSRNPGDRIMKTSKISLKAQNSGQGSAIENPEKNPDSGYFLISGFLSPWFLLNLRVSCKIDGIEIFSFEIITYTLILFFRIFKLKMKMNFPFRLALQSPTSSK